MPILRIEHAVPDFAMWKRAFDADPADRKGGGVRRYEVLRSADDANVVTIDLEFDSLDEAEAFRAKLLRMWSGPARAVARDPVARLFDRVEARSI